MARILPPRSARHSPGGGRPADDMAPVELESGTRPLSVLGWISQILRAAGVGLSIGALLLVIGLAGVLLVAPKLAGAVPLTILTQSMEPTLPPGTLIVVQPVDVHTLHVGDVVTYQIRSGDPTVITHRIQSIASGSDGTLTFTFKGDNNALPDPEPVTEGQIQGKVWYSVPLVGWANQAVNGKARSWIIPAIAFALLAYAAITIITGAVQTRRRRVSQAADDVVADADHVHADLMSEGVAAAARADPSHPGMGTTSAGSPGTAPSRGRHRR